MPLLKARAKHLHSILFTKEGDNSADQWEAYEVRQMIDELKHRYEQCDAQYALIVGTDGTTQAELANAEEIYQKVSEANIRGKLVLSRRLSQLNPQVHAAPVNPGNNILRIVKEHEPSVTKFNGAENAWPAFRDMFSAEVHNRQDIEPLAKLTILKTVCVGRAADALGIWGHTAANYQLAWDYLKKRYENPHNIKQATIMKLISLPCLEEESHDELNHMVNMVDSLSRQLGDMNVPVAQWDDIIFCIIMQRLPRVTITAWKQTQDRDAQLTLAQLLSFTANRAAACQLQRNSNAQNNNKVNTVQDQKNQKKVKHNHTDENGSQNGNRPHDKRAAVKRRSDNHSPEQNVHKNRKFKPNNNRKTLDKAKEPAVCQLCKGEHYLVKCHQFLALTVEKRTELAKNWRLCHICYRFHGKDECAWTGCYRCKGAHHIINCPVKPPKGNAGGVNTA